MSPPEKTPVPPGKILDERSLKEIFGPIETE